MRASVSGSRDARSVTTPEIVPVLAGVWATSPDVTPLKEQDAYPARPEDGYGWEKLCSERMCRHFREDFGLETRVVGLVHIGDAGPIGVTAAHLIG